MRFVTKITLIVLTLACLFATPSTVLAQGARKATTGPQFVPSDEVLAAHPDILEYRYDAQAFRSLHTSDLTVMAIGMYGLNGKDADRVGSLIQKMASEQSKENISFDSLIDRRARHFATLATTAERTGTDLNELILKDEAFSKFRAIIDEAKPGDILGFARVKEVVEQVVDKDIVAQAHETWRDNLQQLGPKVALHSVALDVAAAGGIDDESFLQKLAKERGDRADSVNLDAVGKPDPNIKPIQRMKEQKPRTMRPVKPVDQKTASGKVAMAPSKKTDASSKAAVIKEKAQARQSARRPRKTSEAKRKSPKAKRSTQKTPIASAPPLSQWEQYVRDFIEEHKLSESQTHSALGILNEQQSRARSVMARQESQRKRAAEIQDRRQQSKELAELDQPIDRLFSNLKTRLDQLLTAQQRADARKNATSNRKSKRESKGK